MSSAVSSGGWETSRRWLIACVALVAVTVPAAARAQLVLPIQTTAPGSASRTTTESALAAIRGDYGRSLELADDAIKSDRRDPWGYYDRGNALGYLNRLEEAVAAFQEAEEMFAAGDTWSRSVARWGQANAYNQGGRCKEAAPLYERYATLVEASDAAAAAMARKFAEHCTSRPPRR